jgi:hypothetical protein
MFSARLGRMLAWIWDPQSTSRKGFERPRYSLSLERSQSGLGGAEGVFAFPLASDREMLESRHGATHIPRIPKAGRATLYRALRCVTLDEGALGKIIAQPS